LRKRKVFFEDPKNSHTDQERLDFDGVPYMIMGRKVVECQHGIDRHANEKKRNRESKIVSEMGNVMHAQASYQK
jgi:hypothetical protein